MLRISPEYVYRVNQENILLRYLETKFEKIKIKVTGASPNKILQLFHRLLSCTYNKNWKKIERSFFKLDFDSLKSGL